jgi:alpha-methylacyl-CoA racemase
MALNLPGPAACSRLRDLGATVTKVEPLRGDPFEAYCPAWYARLHDEVTVRRIDLKDSGGQREMDEILLASDLFITAQRPSALARLNLGGQRLAERFPRLCHVAITGHAPPDEELPGHDLTYLAHAGLVTPPSLPPTLFADMAGAERAVTTALALILARDRGRPSQAAYAPLADGRRLPRGLQRLRRAQGLGRRGRARTALRAGPGRGVRPEASLDRPPRRTLCHRGCRTLGSLGPPA